MELVPRRSTEPSIIYFDVRAIYDSRANLEIIGKKIRTTLSAG